MNITVLAGGISSERDVSLKSGEMIARALRENGHKVIFADVFLGIGDEVSFESIENIGIQTQNINTKAPDINSIKSNREKSEDGFFGKNILKLCKASDLVFIALHGEDGENGKLQATFDLLGIRYTGNSSLSCALAMDKTVMKSIFRDGNIPCPPGYFFTKEQWNRGEIKQNQKYPVVVKPACGGSSIGVSMVEKEDDFEAAVLSAFEWEDKVVVEKYIAGREFSVATIRGKALPVIEIAPLSGFYDYKNKYAAGQTVETCPANIEESISKKMQSVAEDVAALFELNTYARMDFLLEEDTNDIYCLEANTLPGMTPTSLIPQEAAVIGIDYHTLCEEIIKCSMEKYK